MIMRHLVLLSLFLSLSITSTFAEERITLTLNEAVKISLEKNLGIRTEKINPKIASQSILSEKGAFDPTLSLSLSESYKKARSASSLTASESRSTDLSISLSGKVTTGTEYEVDWTHTRSWASSGYDPNPYYNSEVKLTITQPLLKGFGTDIQTAMIAVEENNLRISEFGLESKAEEVISATVKAYYDVLLAKEKVKSSRFSLDLAKKILEEVQAKIDAGVMAPVEIYNAEAEVAKREELLLEAENAYRDSLDSLRLTINIEDWGRDLELTPPEIRVKETPSLEESIKNALRYRRDMKKAEIERKKREILTRYYRNQTMPDLEIFGVFGLSGLDDTSVHSLEELAGTSDKNWQIGLSLQIPLWGRSAKGKYLSAKLEQLKAETEIKEIRQRIILETRQAWRALTLSLKRIEATRKTRIASEKRFEAEKERFSVGIATLNDVLRFQEEYTKALFEESRSEFESIKKQVDLEKTTGTLLLRYNYLK
jgi:outer membrane protein TolC